MPSTTRDEGSRGDETSGAAAAGDPGAWPIGRLLSAAARRVERDWNAHLASWDLNHASLPVLIRLLGGPSTQAELAAASGVTEQTMSRVLARMQRTGYIERLPHETDRRKHRVVISERGRAVAREAADPAAADALVGRGLTPAQAEQLRTLLVIVARAPSVAGPPAEPGTRGTARA